MDMKSKQPRGLLRLSRLVRAFWVFVVVLHLVVLVNKVVEGGWQGLFNQVRLILLIAASLYGVVRTWEPLSCLDDISPRRLVALALLVFAGHCAVSSASYARETRHALQQAEWGRVIACVPLMISVVSAGLMLSAFERCRIFFSASTLLLPVHSESPRVSPRICSALFCRPPPGQTWA